MNLPAAIASHRNRRLVAILAGVLALGTGAVYSGAVRNGFVNLDDPEYVTKNPYVLGGLNWHDIHWALGVNYPASNWHPLTWLSHMLDVQLFGMNPAGHHFTNVLLHVLSVLLLFVAIESATHRIWRAVAVAAIFAVQPLNVEAVAWVSERKSVFCVLFFVLGILAYVWYAQKPNVPRYLCVAGCFAAGITAKVMVIPFPCALLLLDYWPLGRLPGTELGGAPRELFAALRSLVMEKVPLFVMAIAGGVITILVHAREHALTAAMPFSWRFKNAVFSYVMYLVRAIWPSGLAPYYPHPENSLSWMTVALCAFVLVGITFLAWRRKERKYVLVGWLWYLGTMLPMIGFIQTGRQGMADRFMHIPMMGLLTAVVWCIADEAAERKWQKEVTIALFLLAAAPYTAVTVKQIGYWHDSYALFEHTLAVTRNNGFAENNFAVALMARGEPELAAQHFLRAVKLSPDLASPHYNLAVLLQRQNQLEEAEKQYRAALQLSSDQTEIQQAHNNLGVLYLGQERLPEAMAELNAAIATDPEAQNSLLGRGMVEMRMGDPDAAVADFSKAASLGPSPVALYWLGQAYERQGKPRLAWQAYELALKYAPQMPEARARQEALKGTVN